MQVNGTKGGGYTVPTFGNGCSWNVRGLNAPNKQKEVKLLCNDEKVSLIGLIETKIKREKLDQLANHMFAGWQYISNLDDHYNGRIWIIWRPDYYRVSLVNKSTQQVTCKVKFTLLQCTFEVTYAYVFNTKDERNELWDNLVVQSRKCTNPWLVLGDFNSILTTKDRIGGNNVIWSEVVDFNNCFLDYGLMEFPTQGHRYTWRDKLARNFFFQN